MKLPLSSLEALDKFSAEKFFQHCNFCITEYALFFVYCTSKHYRLQWLPEEKVQPFSSTSPPGSNFFGKTPILFRYSGTNAANAVNLQAKRR